MRPATELAPWLAGFVAAEGCFVHSGTRFMLSVGVGEPDGPVCELLHAAFGVGRIQRSARRQPGYENEVAFRVQSVRDLVEVVVPFMDEHLPASHKRDQYLAWRTELLDHWEHRFRRRRPCTVDGCAEPARARGLCRHHYYLETGR